MSGRPGATATGAGCWSNAAVTVASPPRNVTVQVAPEQAPPQPPNTDPAAGVAIRVTLVPSANDAEQAPPQLIPTGLLSTTPDPDPLFVMTRARCGGATITAKLAVTVAFVVSITVQAPIPEHAPPQPAKLDPDAASADNVTAEPLANCAEHEDPHETPDGELVTTPAPLPDFMTVRVGVGGAVNVAVTA